MAKVLIVDDTPSQLALMAKVVSGMGHEVVAAGDGESCVAFARSEQPDLILLDVVMPNMDGFNACRRIKREQDTCKIPVIMVTTKDKESDKFWAERQGADGYLVKPFTPESLQKIIRLYIR